MQHARNDSLDLGANSNNRIGNYIYLLINIILKNMVG